MSDRAEGRERVGGDAPAPSGPARARRPGSRACRSRRRWPGGPVCEGEREGKLGCGGTKVAPWSRPRGGTRPARGWCRTPRCCGGRRAEERRAASARGRAANTVAAPPQPAGRRAPPPPARRRAAAHSAAAAAVGAVALARSPPSSSASGGCAPVHALHLAHLVRAQQLQHVAPGHGQLLLLGRGEGAGHRVRHRPGRLQRQVVVKHAGRTTAARGLGGRSGLWRRLQPAGRSAADWDSSPLGWQRLSATAFSSGSGSAAHARSRRGAEATERPCLRNDKPPRGKTIPASVARVEPKARSRTPAGSASAALL